MLQFQASGITGSGVMADFLSCVLLREASITKSRNQTKTSEDVITVRYTLMVHSTDMLQTNVFLCLVATSIRSFDQYLAQ